MIVRSEFGQEWCWCSPWRRRASSKFNPAGYGHELGEVSVRLGLVFFIFWLAKYLGGVQYLNITEIGYYAWIPYAFAGAGSSIGGALSGHLIRRNLTVDGSRKIAVGISAGMMPASLLIGASPLALAIVFFSTAMFGHQFWSTIMQTLAADMFPSKVVGSVAGLSCGELSRSSCGHRRRPAQ